MATIQKRVTSKGTSYRVMVRLKGYPPETATFERLTDAREWATNTEADMKTIGTSGNQSATSSASWLQHTAPRLRPT